MSDIKEFTQAEIDRIVQDRLQRERRKYEIEKEKAREEATADMPDYKTDYYNALKQTKLIEAGFSFEESEQYVKYVDGTEPGEVERQALDLAADISGKKKAYTDPSKQKNKSAWNPFSK